VSTTSTSTQNSFTRNYQLKINYFKAENGKVFSSYLRLAKMDSFSFLLSKATDFFWDLGEFMTYIKLAMVIAYRPQFSSRGKNCV
jgi:hypothetical protein